MLMADGRTDARVIGILLAIIIYTNIKRIFKTLTMMCIVELASGNEYYQSKHGTAQAILVLIASTSSEDSDEPVHIRCFTIAIAACIHIVWI